MKKMLMTLLKNLFKPSAITSSCITDDLQALLNQTSAIHVLCVRLDVTNRQHDAGTQAMFKSLATAIQNTTSESGDYLYEKHIGQMQTTLRLGHQQDRESHLYYQVVDYNQLYSTVSNQQLSKVIPTLWQQILGSHGIENKKLYKLTIIEDRQISQANPKAYKLLARIDEQVRLFKLDRVLVNRKRPLALLLQS